MESLRAYNLKLVANILPLNVAEHFLKKQVNKEEVSLRANCSKHCKSKLPHFCPSTQHYRQIHFQTEGLLASFHILLFFSETPLFNVNSVVLDQAPHSADTHSAVSDLGLCTVKKPCKLSYFSERSCCGSCFIISHCCY